MLDEQFDRPLDVVETVGPVSLSGGLGAYLLLLSPEGVGAVSLGFWGTLKFLFLSGLRRTEELRLAPNELAALKGRAGSFIEIDSLESICLESSLLEADFIKIEADDSNRSVTFRLGDKTQTSRTRSVLGSAYPDLYVERGFD